MKPHKSPGSIKRSFCGDLRDSWPVWNRGLRKCFLCGLFLAFYILCFIAGLQTPAGKDWPLDLLVSEVLLCFCQFPMWCPGSGVVLDCIYS